MGVMLEQVFTLKDREEVESVAPTASTIEQLYDAPNLKVIAPYKEMIEALLIKVNFFSPCPISCIFDAFGTLGCT